MNSKKLVPVLLIALASIFVAACSSGEAQNEPPKVVDTAPKAGDVHVDPATDELKITFDKEMLPDSYSIVKNLSKGKFPELVGSPVLSGDKKTYTQKIKLEPKTNYYISINSDQFSNFKDGSGAPATPFVLEFETN